MLLTVLAFLLSFLSVSDVAPARVIAAADTIVAVTPDNYRIYKSDGTPATFADIVAALKKTDVVFVGEQHDDPVSHHIEKLVLEAMYDVHGDATALSMEMFSRDVQYIVDEYLAGLITKSHFQQSSSPWSNYETDYKPLVEFAKEKGLSVIAANAPRRYANRVTREGRASLMSLSDRALEFVAPQPYGAASEKYTAQWNKVMADAMASMKAAAPTKEEAVEMKHEAGMEHEMGEGMEHKMAMGEGHEGMSYGEGHEMGEKGESMEHNMENMTEEHAKMHAEHMAAKAEGMSHDASMKEKMAGMKGDMAGMKEKMAGMKEKMAGMKNGESMEHNMEGMKHGEGEGHEMGEEGESMEHNMENMTEEHAKTHAEHMAAKARGEEHEMGAEHEMNHAKEEMKHGEGMEHKMEMKHEEGMTHEAGMEHKMEMKHEAPAAKPMAPASSGQHGNDTMLDAQTLWDATMAWSIAEQLTRKPGSKVVHTVGGFHSETGTGTPEHLVQYRPGTRFMVITMKTTDDINTFSQEEHAGMGEFVILGDASLPRTYTSRSR